MSFTVTEAAARQIRVAARQGRSEDMPLRIAAKRRSDGTIDYLMGFDQPDPADSQVEAFGVVVVVAPTSTELVAGMTLDYVELEPGRQDFIFMNPNDPHYIPPREDGD